MAAADRRSSLCLILALVTTFAGGTAAQNQPPDCRAPEECRELALEARGRSAYETFHDLAWRAVQTGRPNDPDLLYLLARAQALSGRRRDALVSLRRLAEAGIPNDAATDDDFRRVRELPEWQGVLALANRPRQTPPEPRNPLATPKPAAAPSKTAPTPPAAANARTAPSAATATDTPPSAISPAAPRTTPPISPTAAAANAPAAAVINAPRATVPVAPNVAARIAPALKRANVEDAARFSTAAFTPAGLAYDAVSRRFLFGDLTGRRLFVVGEGSTRSVDLVRSESAGFDDVTAFAIDGKRGRLWVASTAADGRSAAVHHLQLISGRPLTKFAIPGKGPMRLTDVSVTADGTVLVLDSATPRLLVLRPGATNIEVLMLLPQMDPASMTADENGHFAYVAHRAGISRVDLQARRAATLDAPKGISLADFSFVRLHGSVLFGSQVQPDGMPALVRLQLKGPAVSEATLIDTFASGEAIARATVSGDSLYYVAMGNGSQDATSGLLDLRVKRIALRP